MFRVFLVEDEMVVRESIKKNVDWESYGFKLAGEAGDGEIAYSQIKEIRPDLVITDIKMPVMSGLELLEQIRGRQISDAFFIILSGYNDFSYAQKAIRYACMDYLVKPVQKEALLELIRKAKSSLAVTEQNAENERRMQEMQLKQYIIALLRGKQNEEELKYVKGE